MILYFMSTQRERIDPKTLGLHHSTVLEKDGKSNFFFIVHRKSRIIMKDGEMLKAKVEKVRKSFPKSQFTIETSAPVCSKTEAFLKQNSIFVKRI